MTINGLSLNRYLLNNPIWVDISDAPKTIYLTFLTIDDDVETLIAPYEIKTFNGKASFDISEIIKSIMKEPHHPEGMPSGEIVQSNSTTLTLRFQGQEDDSEVLITKTFIRGGDATMGSNLTLTANAVLKESAKIPVWEVFQSSKYYLNENNRIVYTNILSNEEIERMSVVNCNPLFLRFLNTRGGYSFWLFEEWEVNEKSKKTDRIKRRGNPLDLGLEMEYELETTTRVNREYNATLSALLKSPEIHVYNIANLLNNRGSLNFQERFDMWTQIYNAGGSMAWNSFEEMNEYVFKFDLLFNEKPTLIW